MTSGSTVPVAPPPSLGPSAPQRADLEAALKRQLEALAQRPSDLGGLMNAAALSLQLGAHPAAASLCRQVIRSNPRLGIAHFTLGRALGEAGDWKEALRALMAAKGLEPGNPAPRVRIAQALMALGRTEEALRQAREAAVMPGLTPAAMAVLGDLLHRLGDRALAEVVLRKALAAEEDADTHAVLGALLVQQGQATRGMIHFHRALELAPGSAAARSNLGTAYLAMGDVARGLPLLEEAIALEPGNRDWVTSGVFALNADPEMTLERAHGKTQGWMERAYPPCPPRFRPDHDRAPDRRLRIGYVSADFRQHAMAHWILPLLEARDRSAFEVICFSGNGRKDDWTARFKALADRWVETSALGDEAMADRIVGMKVDILVDLAGHTIGNRLGVFNLKPAPVQAMMLGFDRTSGLRAMDWRVTASNSEHPDADRWSTEGVWRLEGRFAYHPLEGAPEVGPLPALRNGFLTFGFLGNHARVGPPFLQAAARLLQRVPDARLLLLCRGGEDEAHKAFKRSFFREAGVDPERVQFLPRRSGEAAFLAYYGELDITLNSFPAEGGTTVCESIWMGVPVLTLERPEALRYSSRGILEYLGLEAWVAQGVEAWIDRAASWDARREELAALRAGLRSRMAASPVCDARASLRALESAYRSMWQAWCASGDRP